MGLAGGLQGWLGTGTGTAAHPDSGKWQETGSWWEVEIKFPLVLLCFCTSPLLFFIKLPLIQAKSFSCNFLPLSCLGGGVRAAPSSQAEITPAQRAPQASRDNELLITFEAIKAAGHFLKNG